jgi:hypothetical protein
MPIERAAGDLPAELPPQNPVDYFVGSPRLFLLELDSAGQQLGVAFPRLSPVTACLTIQALHALLSQLPPFAPEGPHGDTPPLTVGQQTFLLAQLLEVPLAPPLGNLSQQHGAQQGTPEDGPRLIVTTHRF